MGEPMTEPVCSDYNPSGYIQCEGEYIFGPDPYNWEINDDETPVWLCARHYHESGMDI